MTEHKGVGLSIGRRALGVRACLLLSVAALVACSGEAPVEAGGDEAIDNASSAITLELPPQPSLGCPDVAAAVLRQLGPTQASVTATSGPSYGTIPCNYYVVDVNPSSSSPPGLERNLTMDGFGINRPPATASFVECSDYRERVTFYRKFDATFSRIGGGGRHGVVRPSQIGPTGQIIPQHCAVVEDAGFEPPPTEPRCGGNPFFCSVIRVVVRAYSASTGAERRVRVFVGNLPD